MKLFLIIVSILVLILLILIGIAYIAARVLFSRVIPRQETLKVDISEMADLQKWEEYKKLIMPKKEWLCAQKLEELSITARDGIKLRGYYLKADRPTDRIVIGCHGYTSQGLSDFCAHSYFYHQCGFDCLILDLRGHGQSEGKYIGFGILDRFDLLSWIEYVNKRFDGKKRILLHGTSMGAATVLMTIGFDKLPSTVKGAVSDCAYTSPYDVFSHLLKRDYHLPVFPIMNMNGHMCQKKAGYNFNDYSTLEAVKNAKCPVLFIHGKEDKFVPTWMTLKNHEECRSPKDILIVENAGHGASYYENMPAYEEAEREFIKKWIPDKTESVK